MCRSVTSSSRRKCQERQHTRPTLTPSWHDATSKTMCRSVTSSPRWSVRNVNTPAHPITPPCQCAVITATSTNAASSSKSSEKRGKTHGLFRAMGQLPRPGWFTSSLAVPRPLLETPSACRQTGSIRILSIIGVVNTACFKSLAQPLSLLACSWLALNASFSF